MTPGNGEAAAATAPPVQPPPPLQDDHPAKLHGHGDAQTKVEPSGASLQDVCSELKGRVETFLAEEQETSLLRDVQARLRVSIDVVDEALRRYRPEQIAISYNGGKDCLVLLVLILVCLARRHPSPSELSSDPNTPNGSTDPSQPFPSKFQAVYIVSLHPFPEVDAFVASSGAQYHLQVARYVLPMRKGLEAYLADRPSIQAVFVGTRRTDPHGGELTHFDPTDEGWPAVMRVHPVIDWHYAEIWAFIRHLRFPYCPLYDQGYTSLGGKRDTHPNPQLKQQGRNGEVFLPAYELTEDDEERLGRDR